MKYSIVIVSYKAADKLIKCLQSLTQNPPESGPFTSKADAEIILVDNSPQLIDNELPKSVVIPLLQTYVRFHVIWKPENVGFAEGCNIGVAASNGENIVLINPDTEVFPEWAERLSAHVKPGVGAVGPISNFVAGFQNMYFHMKTAETWEKTARYAAKGLHRRGMDSKLLIGFFMLIPRTVWDKVGGMDPQFFLGCDDLDLSLRLRDAGYSLIIATDVFVYHEGHASFHASGSKSLEYNKQSEKKMLAKLQAKYGDNIPTSSDLWGCEILPTYIPKPMTLSVCMIVRGESEKALLPIADMGPYADEVVVVLTDSHIHMGAAGPLLTPPDGTSGFTYHGEGVILSPNPSNPAKRLYHFPWTDSFADARNFALSKCTCDWVLWLDADDRVPPESAKLIRAALDNPGPLTQAQKCHFGMVIRDDGPDGFNFADGQPRLFPRVYGLEWEGRVHESYMESADRLGIQKVDTNIVIDHTGYKDPALMLKKHERNLRLMRMEEDSPKKFYHMAKNLQALGHYIEAEECYTKTLNGPWKEPLEPVFRDQVRTCMASLIITVKGADSSVDQYLEGNKKPDAQFLRAEVALKRGQVLEAEAMYKDYLDMGEVKDPHGHQRDYLGRVAKGRLETIQRVREEVHAG